MPKVPLSVVSQSIQGTLHQRAGAVADVTAVVDALAHTWQFMAAQLEPVIGVRGVNVLLERALHLTSKDFPEIAQTRPSDAIEDRLNQWQARFSQCDAKEAAEASCALLVTFTELLASLIGGPLTERLLASVWLDTPPPPAEQDTSL